MFYLPFIYFIEGFSFISYNIYSKLTFPKERSRSNNSIERKGDLLNQCKGIFAPILTPFNIDKNIHWKSLELHLERLIQAGIHGIFALGSTSEALFMPLELKKTLVQETLKIIGKRVPVIVQTGCNVIAETLELSNHALECGAETLSIITPYYYPVDERSLIEYYGMLSSKFPQVPICIYNFPSRTGNDIHPTLLAKCKDAAPNIVAIKESSESVERFSQLVAENQEVSVLAGTNSLIYDSLQKGCHGAVATLANVIPEILVGVYENTLSGKLDVAQQLQQEVHEIRPLLKSLGPDLPIYKMAASIFGSYPFEGIYPPQRDLDPRERKLAQEQIKAFYATHGRKQ